MQPLWAITVALSHETKGILSVMKVGSQTRYGKIKVWEGFVGETNCVLMQTGMGPAMAERAAQFLLREFPLTHVLSTGYCGALRDGLKNADAVLADTVLCTENNSPPIESDLEMVQEIRSKLEAGNIALHLGKLITSPQPVLGVKKKEELGKKSGAIAVDMESYSVLKVMSGSKKIASLALRFVVDALHDDLSCTEAFLNPEAGFQPGNLVRVAVRKPKILMELPGLERLALRARKKLNRAVQRIFSV